MSAEEVFVVLFDHNETGSFSILPFAFESRLEAIRCALVEANKVIDHYFDAENARVSHAIQFTGNPDSWVVLVTDESTREETIVAELMVRRLQKIHGRMR